MPYFFTSSSHVFRHKEALRELGFDVSELLSGTLALPEGTPFFVDEDMRPAEPMCSYFFELAKHVEAESLRDYAYDMMTLDDFLARVLDPPADLLSATEEDLVAFRRWRTQLSPAPVGPATWRRNRVAINGFYDWAASAGLVERRPYARRRNGRDALSWGATVDLDVRHLSRAQYLMLHRVGLGGDRPDGTPDPGFRQAFRLRNMVAAELAVTTGMRLREFSCLLDMEVPRPSPSAGGVPVALGAIAKYGYHRVVMVQQRVLRSLELYRRTERAAQVLKSRKALWHCREELFVVDDVDERRMRLSGRMHGRRRSFDVMAMSAPLRRIAVLEAERGLEPLALFVGRGGRMLSASRWQQVFNAAAERARVMSDAWGGVQMPRQVRIHDLRHTFAVFMLRLLTEQVIEDERRRREAGGSGAWLMEHVARSPLLILQRLLGHRDPRNTMKYLRYLEDVNALVARAVEEWTREDRTFADYSAQLASRGSGSE
ncbi:tyrosine-type recombinase/integrase [Streptomyces ardesiacus]|uniref:tyrosine-type recombinase/integrase n=1 Tax=Streptomyces ardesiacus TaxID=285564 RepID=UPI00201EECED|nr:recombinase XerD [Streptomyces ardesiacus]MCL7369592.1 recombinase XerD [Streptomyces ardesiacus]